MVKNNAILNQAKFQKKETFIKYTYKVENDYHRMGTRLISCITKQTFKPMKLRTWQRL